MSIIISKMCKLFRAVDPDPAVFLKADPDPDPDPDPGPGPA